MLHVSFFLLIRGLIPQNYTYFAKEQYEMNILFDLDKSRTDGLWFFYRDAYYSPSDQFMYYFLLYSRKIQLKYKLQTGSLYEKKTLYMETNIEKKIPHFELLVIICSVTERIYLYKPAADDRKVKLLYSRDVIEYSCEQYLSIFNGIVVEQRSSSENLI